MLGFVGYLQEGEYASAYKQTARRHKASSNTESEDAPDTESVEGAVFCTILIIVFISLGIISFEFLFTDRTFHHYLESSLNQISATRLTISSVPRPSQPMESPSPDLSVAQNSATDSADPVIIALCPGYFKMQSRYYIWQLQSYWPFPVKVIRYNDCNTKADIVFCKEQLPKGCIRERQQSSAKVFHHKPIFQSIDGVQYNGEFSRRHERGRAFYISFRSDSALGNDHTNTGSDVVQWGQYFNKFTPNPQVYTCLGCGQVIGGRRNTTADVIQPQAPFPRSLANRKFMLFIVNSGMKHICRKVVHSWNVMMRVAAYDEINESLGKVEAYGNCRKTSDEPYWPELDRADRKEVNVKHYSEFKFSLTMENEVKGGYLTEKMLNGYFAKSIPVYWGAPDVADIINMDRIIHLKITREDMDEAWKLYEDSKGENGYVLSDEQLSRHFKEKHPEWVYREIKKRAAWQFYDNTTNSWKELTMGYQIEDRILFLRKHFRAQFTELTERIRFLNENDDEYMKVVQLPLVKKLQGSEFDPSVLITRFLKVMRSADSYVLDQIPAVNRSRYTFLDDEVEVREESDDEAESPSMQVALPSVQVPATADIKPVIIGLCGGYYKQPTRNYIWQLQNYWPFPIETVKYDNCDTNVDVVFCKSLSPGGCIRETQENSTKVYHDYPLHVSKDGVQYNRDFVYKHERGRAFYISFKSDSALGEDQKNRGSDVTQWGQYWNKFKPNPQVYMCLGCTEVIGVRQNTTMDVLRPQGPFPRSLAQRKFMLFIVNSGQQHICRKLVHTHNVLLRVAAYDEINESIAKVTSWGKCRRTEKEPQYEDFEFASSKKELNVKHYSQFKFSLTMENQIKSGYLTEKMFNGYFAHSIPIYWGAPDIAELINMDRIIHLDISRDEMDEAWNTYNNQKGTNGYILSNEELEKMFAEKHADWAVREIKKRNAFQFFDNTTHTWKEMDAGWEIEDRILFLRKHFRKKFAPMLERIRFLHENEDEYLKVLQLPLVKKVEGTEFDPSVIITRFLRVMKTADSYVLDRIPAINRTRYSFLDDEIPP